MILELDDLQDISVGVLLPELDRICWCRGTFGSRVCAWCISSMSALAWDHRVLDVIWAVSAKLATDALIKVFCHIPAQSLRPGLDVQEFPLVEEVHHVLSKSMTHRLWIHRSFGCAVEAICALPLKMGMRSSLVSRAPGCCLGQFEVCSKTCGFLHWIAFTFGSMHTLISSLLLLVVDIDGEVKWCLGLP